MPQAQPRRRVMFRSAPAAAPAPRPTSIVIASPQRVARRSGSSAAASWRRKYAEVKAKAGQRVRAARESLSGVAGMGAAALGGGAVALAEEYVVEDVAGLPTAIPVAAALWYGARRMNSASMMAAAHGAAGVAGYQLTQEYVIDGIIAEMTED